MTPEIKSFIGIYSENREQQKQAYKGYNFSIKPQGRKYYNEAKEIQKFASINQKKERNTGRSAICWELITVP